MPQTQFPVAVSHDDLRGWSKSIADDLLAELPAGLLNENEQRIYQRAANRGAQSMVAALCLHGIIRRDYK